MPEHEVRIGKDTETGEIKTIGDIDRRSGLYILGTQGTGKTTLIKKIIAQDMRHGHGLFFLDPHGDAIEDLLKRIPVSRQNDVIVLDPRDSEYAFGMNLLACSDSTRWDAREDTFDQAIAIFTKLFADPQKGDLDVWLGKYLRNSFYPLLVNGYTIAEIPLFLKEKPFRDRLLRHPTIENHYQGVAKFWQTEFAGLSPRDQRNEIESTLTRLGSFDRPYITHIVGQSKTSLNFADIMNTGKILFVKLSKRLGDAWKIIGTMLVSSLVHAVRERERIPEKERRHFCIFVDEFQNFANSHDFEVLFTEARKYSIATTIAHQERYGQFADNKRIAGATLTAVHIICFRLTPLDAPVLAPVFAKKASDTRTLPGGELVLSPHPIEDIWDGRHPHEGVNRVRHRYFFIVDLLRQTPQEKYFVFDPSCFTPDDFELNPHTYKREDFPDWAYFGASADMLRRGMSLLNQYYYHCMNGKYDPEEKPSAEQIQLFITITECLGGIFGFMPQIQPVIAEEKRQRIAYLMNEKLRQHTEQERQRYRDALQMRRDKIQALKDQIQYLKDHGVKEERWGSVNHSSSTALHPRNPVQQFYHPQPTSYSSSSSTPVLRYVNGTKEDFEKQEKYLESLHRQILALERSYPPGYMESQYTDMSFSVFSTEDIKQLYTVAIQAGMPLHEVEQLVAWELQPITWPADWVMGIMIKRFITATEDTEINEALECYLTDSIGSFDGPFFVNWKNVSQDSHLYRENISRWRREGYHWQMMEFCIFIRMLFLYLPQILCEEPIKIPSGHYDESPKREKTQDEMITEMEQELNSLPNHTAYIKTAVWKGKMIQPLPDDAVPGARLVDGRPIARQKALNAQILRKRSVIEVEIRERQENWRRLPDTEPPRTDTGYTSPPLLPSEGAGQAQEPPPTTYLSEMPPALHPGQNGQAQEPPPPHALSASTDENVPQRRTLPLQVASLDFFESGEDNALEGEHTYRVLFPQCEARYILYELRMENLQHQHDQTYHLLVRYFFPDGSLLCEDHSDCLIESEDEGVSLLGGAGVAERGCWLPGTYRVAINLDGVAFAEGCFTITEADVPAPTAEDSAEGNGRLVCDVTEGTAVEKIHYPLNMELIGRILDGLGLQYSVDPAGDIVISATPEKLGNTKAFVWINISGENKDRLLIRGGVNVKLLESEFAQALATCNEFNKITFYGRAVLHINDDNTEGYVYFDSRVMLTDGVAEDFLRSFIEQSLYCSSYFFSMAHDEGLY